MTIPYVYCPDMDDEYAETCQNIVDSRGLCMAEECPNCPGYDYCKKGATGQSNTFRDNPPSRMVCYHSAKKWLEDREAYKARNAEKVPELASPPPANGTTNVRFISKANLPLGSAEVDIEMDIHGISNAESLLSQRLPGVKPQLDILAGIMENLLLEVQSHFPEASYRIDDKGNLNLLLGFSKDDQPEISQPQRIAWKGYIGVAGDSYAPQKPRTPR